MPTGEEIELNVLITAYFKAACSGNFINSLLALADKGTARGHGFTFLFPLKDDGGECGWADYMRGFGYEVLMYNEYQPTEETEKMLFELIDDKKIDLIHTHFSCLNNILLWNKEIHKKVKIIFHDHMDYVARKPVWPQIKKQLKVSKRYREYGLGVISVMKRKHRFYFLTPKRWYIPNGITFRRNVDVSLSRESERESLGLAEDEKLVLFMGWDAYGKGLDIAIKSVTQLRSAGKKIVLGVVGLGDRPAPEQLERIRNDIGFDPCREGVRFLGNREDMFALHRAADVFLSASRKDAFSYSILEAISQNVPVVSSNISGTRWCLKYSKSFTYPVNDHEKCAHLISKAVELRDEPSNSKEITDKYNIDVWCDRVLRVYEQMFAAR